MSEIPPAPTYAPAQTNEERTWAMLCHIASLAGYVIPFGNILGPLVMWLIKKDEMPLVNDQGKEAINFNISITVYVMIALVLIIVLIGIPLLILLGLMQFILTIVAAVSANGGKQYRYPLTFRLVR